MIKKLRSFNKNLHSSRSQSPFINYSKNRDKKCSKLNYKFTMKFLKGDFVLNLISRHKYSNNIEKNILNYDIIENDDNYYYLNIKLIIKDINNGNIIKRMMIDEITNEIYIRNIYGNMTNAPINYYMSFF